MPEPTPLRPRSRRIAPSMLVERDSANTLRFVFGEEPAHAELTLTNDQAEKFQATIGLMLENGEAEG